MIRLEALSKIFETAKGRAVAADAINMDVAAGEICVLLGPSGCGKTTTLKMINRLVRPTAGKIFIKGRDTRDFNDVALRRQIGYVIQQIGLFPNKTVAQNICVVPDLLGWDRQRSRRRAAELLDMAGLKPDLFLDRYPSEISGGQQQRVGVLRALAADPPVMLMDEPFGAIDPVNRATIQDEFLKIQRELGTTVMFVSHDIDEAVKMADKIAIFRAGKLQQMASPDDILAHPANDFVRGFVGADRTLKRLGLIRAADAMAAEVAGVAVEVDAQGRAQGYRLEGERGLKDFPASVRPEDDLRAVVSRLFRHDMSWLPVIDEAGVFQGLVSQQGIARLLAETYDVRPREGG